MALKTDMDRLTFLIEAEAELAPIEQTVVGILKDFGGVDILVNNAGIVSGDNLVDLSYEKINPACDRWRRMNVKIFFGHAFRVHLE